jgi:hypothetical protein
MPSFPKSKLLCNLSRNLAAHGIRFHHINKIQTYYYGESCAACPGCPIDSSVEFIQSLEQKYADLLDKRW